MVKKHQVNQEENYRPHFFADFSGKLPLPNFSFYKHVPPHASLYVKVIPMIITKVKSFLNVYNKTERKRINHRLIFRKKTGHKHLKLTATAVEIDSDDFCYQ